VQDTLEQLQTTQKELVRLRRQMAQRDFEALMAKVQTLGGVPVLAAQVNVADVDAMRAAITPNTILLVGSAPAYSQGVVDPIPEIAALAQEKGPRSSPSSHQFRKVAGRDATGAQMVVSPGGNAGGNWDGNALDALAAGRGGGPPGHAAQVRSR
jgi:alanyl-tRNA synthetase